MVDKIKHWSDETDSEDYDFEEMMKGDINESSLSTQLTELQSMLGEKTLSPFDYAKGLEMLRQHYKETNEPDHVATIKKAQKEFQKSPCLRLSVIVNYSTR